MKQKKTRDVKEEGKEGSEKSKNEGDEEKKITREGEMAVKRK